MPGAIDQHRKDKIVDAVVVGNANSIAQAAKYAGVHRHTAARYIRDSTILAKLEERKQERLDKAGGAIEAALRQVKRFSKQLDRADLDSATPIELAQLQRNAVEVYKSMLDLSGKYGLDQRQADPQLIKGRTRRAAQLGAALAQGKALLGWKGSKA
jgi:hypothetical protein